MKVFNTKSKKLEQITPINEGEILLYTCGPTVYDAPHIGNLLAYIRWDILVRGLAAEGYSVKRVMNITDVGHLTSDSDEGEDKLEKGAKREGKTAWEVAEMYTNIFFADMQKLGLVQPTYITKATSFIPQQIELVKTLESKGYTYTIDDGVYFDTSKFTRYADFAKLNLNEIKKGARVEYNQQKRNPSDFALWKLSPQNETRDMEWQSPWGKGFPGWHLECSAMALAKLGETIDIHTGGIDHIPVHHTNEIAQTEAATGKTFANYWLHANFIMSNGSKISKSLNNGYTLQDLSKKGFSPSDFKMLALQSHYRSESNFTWENLQSAQNRLANWRRIASLQWQTLGTGNSTPKPTIYTLSTNKITAAILNDLDTPAALIAVESALNFADINGVTSAEQADFGQFLVAINSLLGLRVATQDITANQKNLLHLRQLARGSNNWAQSDQLRLELQATGLQINDSKNSQIWHRTPSQNS